MAGQALYYGMNALSHNVIMADRKKLKSANGMYLGSTGSGKSFAAKRELLNVFLTIPQDRIIVVDPMGEYAPLVRRLGGQVIEIAPDSPHHLNPMDVELNMAAGESPLSRARPNKKTAKCRKSLFCKDLQHFFEKCLFSCLDRRSQFRLRN